MTLKYHDSAPLKTFGKSWEHLRNSLIMLEIGKHWPCFEVVENLSTPSVIFGRRREIFGNLWKSSEIFSNLLKSSENFGNLPKPSANLWKFRFCEDQKSHAFYWKKLTGIATGHLQTNICYGKYPKQVWVWLTIENLRTFLTLWLDFPNRRLNVWYLSNTFLMTQWNCVTVKINVLSHFKIMRHYTITDKDMTALGCYKPLDIPGLSYGC